ncbi:hypothetical protein G1K66_11805 [Tenacibaculum finnmarkense]|uniref:hypothetical protein n=1 Tax=Tenacibaculum finnmarkense TaxID=2781243 RepID=UPI001EFA8AB6|nr:hypothetical protein [Tenacibaculum finnmarkense]MCG8813938.1 hypothetical protein [Tenacibaculum finnmarkense]
MGIKTTHLRNLIFIVLLFCGNILFSQSIFTETFYNKSSKDKNCNTELKVKKNRNVKSISPSSKLKYHLVLTNNSKIKNTYKLNVVELKKSCSNNTSKENVPLKLSIVPNKNANKYNVNFNKKITLDAGQSYHFKVKVSLLKNTPIERWNCSEIQVTSLKCNEIVASALLKTFVQNPSLR